MSHSCICRLWYYLLERFVNKASPKAYKSPKRTKWSTMAGSFTTKQKRLVEFSFPEFSTEKTIAWTVHVDERTDSSTSTYDMVIGTDLMDKLGIKMDFQDLYNTAMGFVLALGGWVMRVIWDNLKDLRTQDTALAEKVSRIEVLVAGEYVRKDELERVVQRLFDKLEHIEMKIDRKADKN